LGGRSHGFTLIEFLTALALVLILGAGLTAVYLMSVKAWRQGSLQVTLQRKLAVAMDRMVLGQRTDMEHSQHGLREAEQITIMDPHTLEYTSGIDGLKRQFYLSGNEIIYDPGNIASEHRIPIYDPSRQEKASEGSNHRTNLQFTQMANAAVEIRLVGQRRSGNNWINAELVTAVKPRN